MSNLYPHNYNTGNKRKIVTHIGNYTGIIQVHNRYNYTYKYMDITLLIMNLIKIIGWIILGIMVLITERNWKTIFFLLLVLYLAEITSNLYL